MIIKVDDTQLFELTEIQKKVIQNDIPVDIFDEDMKRRLFNIINHKYDQCFKRLKAEWDPRLGANGVTSIPFDKDAYATLVFSQPDYKDRAARDLEVAEKV